MPRRYQRGSLKARRINGRKVWYAQWWENGHHRAKILGPCSKMNAAEAKRALEAIVAPLNAQLERGIKRPLTMRQFVEQEYLPTMNLTWKLSTSLTTTHRIQHMILPHWGDRLLVSITRQELQAWLLEYAKTHSAAVVQHLRWDLRSIFAMAQADGIVPYNPAGMLLVPRKARAPRPKPALSEEQVRQYLAVLPLRERLAARLAIFEGLRPGEILALRWEDVQGDCLRVERRIYHGELDTPKNARPRVAALSRGTLELLKVWYDDIGGCTPWIFGSRNHTPLRQENYWRTYMLPHLKPIGLQWATWQALRRTNASLMAKYGADPKVGADQRGHGIGVSIDIYTQSDLDQKRAAVQMLEDALRLPEEDRLIQ